MFAADDPTPVNDIIGDIADVRVSNNVLWMAILAIAMKHAPEETKSILKDIRDNDRQIYDLLGDLTK